MAAPLSGKKIAKNAAMSVTAQLVSVLVGFVLNLVVPKYISEYDYSYWQTFLLYSQYLGILHFACLMASYCGIPSMIMESWTKKASVPSILRLWRRIWFFRWSCCSGHSSFLPE